MEKIINDDVIKKIFHDTLSSYFSESYLKGFISKVVAEAVNERESNWDSKTIIEKQLIQTVRKIAIEELEKLLNENREKIREAVKKMLNEKGLDLIIDRISKANASALVDALKIEAWVEK
jgi:flagellar biosynthesis/type III secretory pathway protein FliH